MHDTVMARLPLAQTPNLIKLMRPRQWLKNGLVLAPLLFSGAFIDVGVFSHALLAVLLYCTASSMTCTTGFSDN
jgi:4-hydroxybenzoate polyprenyltransferase